MTMIAIGHGIKVPRKFWNEEAQALFPDDLLRLITSLQDKFGPRRQQLLLDRQDRQVRYDNGELPHYLERESEAVRGTWRVAPLPPELICRRVEITGPVNSAKMVINMLSRNEHGARADTAMLDFEDSMKPSFENVLSGYHNVRAAVAGDLTFTAPNKVYRLDPRDMAYVMVRCRGLHLNETNFTVDGCPVSAGLLDLAVCFFHTARIFVAQKKSPKYYIPKCEHHQEARWWNDLFCELEHALDLKRGTLRATFLIETLPASFQVEEILYEIRDHAAGLNVGRWDKIFSDIKVLKNHPDRIIGDRASITMTRPWMENYAKRVIKICHQRGALAMGGMSAFTPGKDERTRAEQTAKVREDKQREASWGHDGCWVSHPYFIGVAMEAFTAPNQLERTLPEFDKYADILPQGTGPYTLAGLRTNVRVGIAYMHGWLQEIGCVSFDDLMEDLATLEISRAQVWQWLHHRLRLDDGEAVTRELVERVFDEEFDKIQQEWRTQRVAEHLIDRLTAARDEAKRIFLKAELDDFLSCASDPA